MNISHIATFALLLFSIAVSALGLDLRKIGDPDISRIGNVMASVGIVFYIISLLIFGLLLAS